MSYNPNGPFKGTVPEHNSGIEEMLMMLPAGLTLVVSRNYRPKSAQKIKYRAKPRLRLICEGREL